MVEILRRLARLTRAHLHDLMGSYLGGGYQPSTRDAWTDSANEEPAGGYDTPSSFESHSSHSVPYSEALAANYRVLDLPFGIPMDQVAKRWKTYLKKCHPDRYANDPEKQAEATELTQELTRAYEVIKAAWKQHCP